MQPRLLTLASQSAWLFMSAADRKSTRLNSSHLVISYAVFCLKKKKSITPHSTLLNTPSQYVTRITLHAPTRCTSYYYSDHPPHISILLACLYHHSLYDSSPPP